MKSLLAKWPWLNRSRVKRWAAGGVLLSCGAAGIFLITLGVLLSRAEIDVERYLWAEPSPTLLDRTGRLLHASLNESDAWCLPVEARAHSRYVRDATIAVEDQRFERHGGVDVAAVFRAAAQAVRHGRVTSGASTLTMQLVKITDDSPRTVRGKLGQMWTAMVLERHATKDEILGAYLNRAPYGANLVGIRAASLRYFGKESEELTLSESALLAGVPKSPARLDPLRHPEKARVRRDFVLHRMFHEDRITRDALRNARSRPVGAAWHGFPAHMPHLAQRLKRGEESSGRLTIDLDEQVRVQSLLRRHVAQFDGAITHGAVIALDVQSGEVIARAGSPEFFGAQGGQIDMVAQPRPPGSALKPFVFAEAMERNRLYPSEVLLDGPLDYGQYNPGNYDGKFNGLVSATEALRYSLNVPAVMLLDRVGVASFQQRLRALGFSTATKPPEHYGLGLVLGNCEVRLDEMAAAYLTLANLGEYRPVRILLEGVEAAPARRVWSKGVATAMYEMLEQPLPKELHDGLIRANNSLPHVCWKTGTSTGHHDAWAFVFNGQYLVGVWIGNADGRRSKRLVGASAALPLAGQVFRGLKPSSSLPWPSSSHLREIKVCAVSGLPLGDWCSGQKSARVPSRQFLNRTCKVHQDTNGIGDVAAVWPADARHWDLAKVEPRRSVAGNSNPTDTANKLLRIVSPADRSEFRLSGVEGGDRIRLRSSLSDTSLLYWYCDERYLGESTPQRPLYTGLTQGKHRLSCMTRTGETDMIVYTVLRGSRI